MNLKAPPARRIRALFVDLDGTLVSVDEQVSPRVRRAIEQARAAGCAVILCTGRTRFTAQPIADQLDQPGYLVASNGGVAMHLETGKVVHSLKMPIPLALDVAKAIISVGASPYIYEDSTLPGVENARVLYHPDLPVGHFATPPRYRPHAALLEDLPFVPISVSAFGPIPHIRPLVAPLQERLAGQVSIVQTGTETTWGIEIYVANVTKRTGAEAVVRELGLEREETLAIGDHFNDIELLQWAGLGVAMGNAQPEVQAAADYVTGSLHEDGVAQAIERFIL
jgi:Cof subfamily protein (haloacid dehalogenase superfamily)